MREWKDFCDVIFASIGVTATLLLIGMAFIKALDFFDRMKLLVNRSDYWQSNWREVYNDNVKNKDSIAIISAEQKVFKEDIKWATDEICKLKILVDFVEKSIDRKKIKRA